MKQILEQTALLLASFFGSVVLGWLAADYVHHVAVVIQNILASA